MRLAYFLGTSLIDYPGKLAAILWTVGCNLRCPFCYNAELVLPEFSERLAPLDPKEVLHALRERRGFLDGLVVTGGEPTIQGDLPEFLAEVRALGLSIKLDTNGTRPEVLATLLDRGLVDYVAMDIKAPFPRYQEFTGLPAGVPELVAKIKESISILARGAPNYELRTTAAPGLSEDNLAAIARYLGSVAHGTKTSPTEGQRYETDVASGVPARRLVGRSGPTLRGSPCPTLKYVLQPFFLPEGKRLVDESWRDRPHLSTEELKGLLPRLNPWVPTEVRG
jgi:pyruvate formate lyase activating enzyme